MEILEQLKDILVEKFNLTRENIQPESTFDSLALDSLAVMEILVDVEDKFNIEFEDLSTLKNLRDVSEYIEQRQHH